MQKLAKAASNSAVYPSCKLDSAIAEDGDEKRIAFNPAVELSYLPEEAQKKLLEIMDMQQNTPSLSQAQMFSPQPVECTCKQIFKF